MYVSMLQGTIEEKIYQRQISKQGLSGAVMDSKRKCDVQFSLDDLKVYYVNIKEGKYKCRESYVTKIEILQHSI